MLLLPLVPTKRDDFWPNWSIQPLWGNMLILVGTSGSKSPKMVRKCPFSGQTPFLAFLGPARIGPFWVYP